MRLMQGFFWIFIAVSTGYVVLVVLMYLFQARMMYHPVEEIYQTPSAVGLDYEKVSFRTDDGILLSGWYVPARKARGTVLFNHGNAGNISGRLETIHILHTLNLDVFIYDYRGYGRSEGKPSERGTYSDAMAAWRYLVEQKNLKSEHTVIMGRSLGGAVAAWLSARVAPAGLILESTFTSAKDLAAELYPIFPVRWLMTFEYPTLAYLKNSSVPLLVLHSKEDGLVPYRHGRKLYERASQPKTFFEMQGGHGGGHIESGRAYIQALDDFFNSTLSENAKK